jgi:hypothetical protein
VNGVGYRSQHERRLMTVYGRSSWLLSAVAIALLLMGGLVYLICRNGSSVYFLAITIPEAVNYPVSAGHIYSSVPSFFHIYAFILLTTVVVKPCKAGLIRICLGWIIVELFFEIGQHPFFAQHLTKLVPSWFADFPFLEVADTYFLTGTFDPVDVLFILFGTTAAFLALQKFQRWEVYHVKHQ